MADGLSYIGVGSNVCPAENILRALDLMSRVARVVSVSSVWRSPPFGKSAGQPDFLNAVWAVRWSECTSLDISQKLHDIEAALGRDRPHGDSWAPRTIDLDMIWWEGAPDVIASDVRERPFVAVPLLEVAPKFVMSDGIELSSLRVAHDCSALGLDTAVTRSVRDLLLNQVQG